MISERKISNKKNIISINRQIYDKINSKNKLNFKSNIKNNEPNKNNIHITPIKLSKYSALYSKYKSYSKATTKSKTTNKTKNVNTPMKSNELKQNFSVCQLVKLNLDNKYRSSISNFNNSILYPKTQNKKSRNIFNKFQKNVTVDKRNSLDKLYPNTPNHNSSSLMYNTMKNFNSSYKKFFLSKKKVKIASKEKSVKKTYRATNTPNIKKMSIKKYKIAINDEDFLNNKLTKNKINDKIIKSILNLKNIQNKIQNEFYKKNEKIQKKQIKNDYSREFSFKKEYIFDCLSDGYYDSNEKNSLKDLENNNEKMIDIVNKKVNNLIQSNILTGFSDFDKNQGIYEENYECDTPQFTTLDVK